MFEVRVDHQCNRLHVTLSGFASLDDVQRFQQDFTGALGELPVHRGPHQLVYDVSAAKIQSQEVVAALREFVRTTPRTSAFALVNASALAGRQLGRIFAGLEIAVFQNPEAATAWLDSQGE